MKAAATMTAIEQWQWFLALRRGSEQRVVRIEKHGTPGEYVTHKCRCDECRAAWNKYNAPYRKDWVERNRDHVRAYNAAYQREYRARKKAEAAK